MQGRCPVSLLPGILRRYSPCPGHLVLRREHLPGGDALVLKAALPAGPELRQIFPLARAGFPVHFKTGRGKTPRLLRGISMTVQACSAWHYGES